MSQIENQLRAALREKGEQVPPDAIPALRLPADPVTNNDADWMLTTEADPGRTSAARRRSVRVPRWVPPAAAAASVLAIAVAVAVIAGMAPGKPGTTAGAKAGVPPYYVALQVVHSGCCRPGEPYALQADAVVRATVTGSVVASVAVPKPYFAFVAVSAEANGTSFVLAAQRLARFPLSASQNPATQFFLLKIDPTGADSQQRTQLSALPIPILRRGTQLAGIAVSPDGASLAVSSTSGTASPNRLHVFDMTTGAERTWLGPVFGGYGPGAYQGYLSWASDNRTLALIAGGANNRAYLLDTDAKSKSLAADSKVALRIPGDGEQVMWRDAMITPNGRVLLVVLEISRNYLHRRGFSLYERLEKYDAGTGRLRRVLNIQVPRGAYEQVLWSSPTGRVLVVNGTGPRQAGAGIYVGGHFSPIPWNPRILTAAW